MLHALLMFAYIRLEARERWLVRLRPFLGLMNAQQIVAAWSGGEKKKCVYVMASQMTSLSYVGSTNCFYRRMSEHIRFSRDQGSSKQKVHRVLKAFGLHGFAMFPVLLNDSSDFRRVEEKLIRILKPRLNVDLGPVWQRKSVKVLQASGRPLMKQRHLKPCTREIALTMYCVPVENSWWVSLVDLLEAKKDESDFRVELHVGQHSLENRHALKLNYGLSKIKPGSDDEVITLREFLSHMNVSSTFIVCEVQKTGYLLEHKAFLLDILTYPRHASKLFQCSLLHLYRLFCTAQSWKCRHTRQKLLLSIDSVFAKKCGLSFLLHVFVKVSS
jgi:hypothetical protein